MVCLYCGAPTSVKNSRPMKRMNGVWRRRQCVRCGGLITTIEQADLAAALRVSRPDGHLEPFQRDKLYISIYESLRHRKTAQEDASQLCDTIVQAIVRRTGGPSCPIALIKEEAVGVLQRFDRVAATHYRAYYPA